jgi:hypothetical protein
MIFKLIFLRDISIYRSPLEAPEFSVEEIVIKKDANLYVNRELYLESSLSFMATEDAKINPSHFYFKVPTDSFKIEAVV